MQTQSNALFPCRRHGIAAHNGCLLTAAGWRGERRAHQNQAFGLI